MDCTYLNWDSNFFHKKIYKLTIDKNFDETKFKEITKTIDADLIYIFYSHQNNAFLNHIGAKLIDEKVLYIKPVEYVENTDLTGVSNYTDTNSHHAELLNLALISGQYSRFKIDPVLNSGFKKMYETWVNRSISFEIADIVFTYNENNSIKGFVTIKINELTATIGLIAVDEKYQGKKIGKKLLSAVNHWCFNKNIEHIEVATQLANKQACHFYSRSGYIVKNITNIYHYYPESRHIKNSI